MRRNQLVFVAVVTLDVKIGGQEVYRWSTSPVDRKDPVSGDELHYEPCITTVPTIDGKVGMAIWGNKSQSSLTDLVISARAFPLLMEDYRMRDANIEFFLLSANDYGAISEKSIFKGVVNSMKKEKEHFHIKVGNYLSLLDRPANQKVFAETTSNSSIIGQAVPFVIGDALSCPLTALAPYNDDFIGTDEAAMAYQTVYDNGDALLDTDWVFSWDTTHTAHYVHLNSPDYGVITADIKGREGDYDLEFYNDWLQGRQISDPVPWSTGDPQGWTHDNGGGATIYESPSTGFCVFDTSTQTSAYTNTLTCTHNGQKLIAGRQYKVTITHRYWGDFATSGTLGLRLFCGTQQVGFLPPPSEDSAYRTTVIEFTAESTDTFWIRPPNNYTAYPLRQGIGDVKIERVSGTNNLTNFCHNLMVRRGGIDTAKINWASFQAIQDLHWFPIGYFSSKPVNIQTVLDEVNRTYNSFIIDNGDGEIFMGKLVDPESITSPAFTIDNSNQAGLEKKELDQAKGLSDTMVCRKNNYVFDRDRIAASVSIHNVERIIKPFRKSYKYGIDTTTWPHSSMTPLHDTYSHAVDAEPLQTLLQDAKYARQLINEWAGLYTKERYFLYVPVTMNALDVRFLDYGDMIEYDGKKHILVGKKYQFATNIITLKLWR